MLDDIATLKYTDTLPLFQRRPGSKSNKWRGRSDCLH